MTKKIEVGNGRDSAFNRALAEVDGSIYPLLGEILETYVRTRCPHEARGNLTAVEGEHLCESCSNEVLLNLRSVVGSGDIEWDDKSRQDLDVVCNLIPLAAIQIWGRHGNSDENADAATKEIGSLVTDVCRTVSAIVGIHQVAGDLKERLRS